jgi:hypothetical protein
VFNIFFGLVTAAVVALYVVAPALVDLQTTFSNLPL